jgi:chemotaxis signal transduction protein
MMVAEVSLRAGGAPDGSAAGVEFDDDGARRLYLTCVVGGETYLVPARSIREVEEVRAVTPVPNTPAWLLGVMNLRGSIVGVADLARFLGLAGAGPQPRPAPGGSASTMAEALVCGQDEATVALAVEAVSAIRPLADAEILPLPELHGEGAAPTATRYLAGLYRAAGSPGDAALVGVLDLDGVLRALEGPAAPAGSVGRD